MIPSDIESAFLIFNSLKTDHGSLDESSYTAMIRCCCQHSPPNLLPQALSYYNELKELKILPKSRTLTPWLAAFASSKEWADICIEVFFSDLLELFQLIPTEKDYQSMLQVVLLLKDAALFGRIYELLQQDVYTPTQTTTDLLISIFTSVLEGYSIFHAIPKQDGLLLFEPHENEKNNSIVFYSSPRCCGMQKTYG